MGAHGWVATLLQIPLIPVWRPSDAWPSRMKISSWLVAFGKMFRKTMGSILAFLSPEDTNQLILGKPLGEAIHRTVAGAVEQRKQLYSFSRE